MDAKRRSLDFRDSVLTSIYTSPGLSNDQSPAKESETWNSEVQESPTSPVLSGKGYNYCISILFWRAVVLAP